MNTYFSATELLAPPTERAAFSDRQAYVCAELSKLAYFKFEGGHTLDQVLEIARKWVSDSNQLAALEQQLRNVLTASPASQVEARKAFEDLLGSGGFTLVETFSREGTQAYLCKKSIDMPGAGTKTVGILAFRGTEPKDFRDIKSDIKARLSEVELNNEKVELHTGYLSAFRLIEEDLLEAINKASINQLFITGHSLGGALAIVFTRLHAADTNGACYTFGAPPVGTINVQNRLKTPVYEIVNEVDIVPRLPNPWMTTATVWLLKGLRLLAKLFTVMQRALASGSWDEKLEAYVEAMTRYRHPGYVSYLVGSGSAARLRYNVSGFDRFRWWSAMLLKGRLTSLRKAVSDHMIDVYIDQLKSHARKRQN